MSDEGQRGTTAADSAPGVGDGPARNAEPQHFTQPRGRKGVWIGIGVVLALLLVVFIARPRQDERPAVLPEPERYGGVETAIPYAGPEPAAPDQTGQGTQTEQQP
jgi:hypothetical protein